MNSLAAAELAERHARQQTPSAIQGRGIMLEQQGDSLLARHEPVEFLLRQMRFDPAGGIVLLRIMDSPIGRRIASSVSR